jgi:hypothetical protein
VTKEGTLEGIEDGRLEPLEVAKEGTLDGIEDGRLEVPFVPFVGVIVGLLLDFTPG